MHQPTSRSKGAAGLPAAIVSPRPSCFVLAVVPRAKSHHATPNANEKTIDVIEHALDHVKDPNAGRSRCPTPSLLTAAPLRSFTPRPIPPRYDGWILRRSKPSTSSAVPRPRRNILVPLAPWSRVSLPLVGHRVAPA